MKKYKVHMGMRLTCDYYIKANDEEEAIRLAELLFETTPYHDMQCAGTDSDAWEEDFPDEWTDDEAEEEE